MWYSTISCDMWYRETMPWWYHSQYVGKDAYYIASLWKRCRLYLLGGGLISVVISSWSALPKRFVSRNSSPNLRGAPSRNAVNSTPSDWCYYCRHMALVLIPRHQHALVLIFVPFFLEFADRAMNREWCMMSQKMEKIFVCLPLLCRTKAACLTISDLHKKELLHIYLG